MQITRIDANNQNKPYFGGRTKALSKEMFPDGKREIMKLLKDNNNIVGELPNCIFSKLTPENKHVAMKEIYAAFAVAAAEIRAFVPSIQGDSDEYKNKRQKTSVAKLKNVFVKYNILKPEDEFDLQYIERDPPGAYKKAFIMKGLSEETTGTGDVPCFKVFHKVDTSQEWHRYKRHGNFAELNNAMYWKSKEGDYANINRFYCGDMLGGYLIDRYIPDVYHSPKKFVDMYRYGVKNTDIFSGDDGHNVKNGYSFDQGGPGVVNRVKNQSDTVIDIMDILYREPGNCKYLKWNEIAYGPRYKRYDKMQKWAGLGLGIKFLNPKQQIAVANTCMALHQPLVDMAVAYALKYMPQETSIEYFRRLMQRNNPEVQVVLLNEIPRLSTLEKNKYDDIRTPKQAIDPEVINIYYQIGKELALPEVKEHL